MKTDALQTSHSITVRATSVNGDGVPHLRLHPDGRCLALRGRIGGRVRCTIYEHRPAACRKVEPGSERCMAHRREHRLMNAPAE